MAGQWPTRTGQGSLSWIRGASKRRKAYPALAEVQWLPDPKRAGERYGTLGLERAYQLRNRNWF